MSNLNQHQFAAYNTPAMAYDEWKTGHPYQSPGDYLKGPAEVQQDYVQDEQENPVLPYDDEYQSRSMIY